MDPWLAGQRRPERGVEHRGEPATQSGEKKVPATFFFTWRYTLQSPAGRGVRRATIPVAA
jgi:hypothetical protein